MSASNGRPRTSPTPPGAVYGIDPGLATGATARIDHNGHTTHRAWTTPVARDLTATARRIRAAEQLALTLINPSHDHADAAALAVIEGPSYASTHGAHHERAAAWWRTTQALLDRGIRVAICPPGVLKRWATGHGHAPKHDMRTAAELLWPDLPTQTTEHEIDALLLAALGAHHLDRPGPWALHNRAALDSITWPDWPGQPDSATVQNASQE